MLIGEPGRTNYDLQFQIFGFPVRIHPAFFILPVVLGARTDPNAEFNVGVTVALFAVVFLISILIHEMGHTLAFRRFGIHSRIVLYWLGGLAIPDSGSSWAVSSSRSSVSSNQQIIVSLAGPFAGFCLAAIFTGLVYLLGGSVIVEWYGLFPDFFPDLRGTTFEGNTAMYLFLKVGIWANVFWNLLNLAPVFPLDGGQVAREVFVRADPVDGIRKSLMLAVIVAGIIGIAGLATQNHFMGIFFLLMAYSNFMTIQQMNFRGGGRGPW